MPAYDGGDLLRGNAAIPVLEALWAIPLSETFKFV